MTVKISLGKSERYSGPLNQPKSPNLPVILPMFSSETTRGAYFQILSYKKAARVFISLIQRPFGDHDFHWPVVCLFKGGGEH